MVQKILAHLNIKVTNEDIFENAVTVEPDAKSSGISSSMITKIGKAGRTLENLLQSYNTSRCHGIEILLEQDVGGHPRVTKTKKVIGGLSYKLAELTVKRNRNVETTWLYFVFTICIFF